MRLLLLPALLMLPAFAMEQGGSITLDPAEMERMKQSVFGGSVVQAPTPQAPEAIAPSPSPATAEEQRWLCAMESAGDVQTILLLSVLQQLNPRLPMAEYPRLYAEALELHRSAAAGDPVAVANLAACLHSGALPNGLTFLRAEHLAQQLGQCVEEKISQTPNK